MRKLQIVTLTLIFCLVAASPPARVSATRHHRDSSAYAPGEIIIKLKENAHELNAADLSDRATSMARIIDKRSDEPGERALQPLARTAASKRAEEILSRRGLDRVFVLKVDRDADIDSLIGELQSRDDIEYAEPNYRIKLGSVTPNDARYYDQWGLKNWGNYIGAFPATPNADIKADLAWEITTGSPDVIVAVTDTGVDITHPDLARNIYVNRGEIAGNGIDDDHNGYIDDVNGFNVAEMNGDVTDVAGHGTQMAGIIAAEMGNEIGIVGVSQSKILPVRFFRKLSDSPGDYDATIADAARALIYSIAAGASIINASWRTLLGMESAEEAAEANRVLMEAVAATDDAGVLLVCIAGNEGYDNDYSKVYPGAYQLSNEIVVAASDYNDEIWHPAFNPYEIKTGFGQKTVALTAPGVSILTTAARGNCPLCSDSKEPGEWYVLGDGTSLSAAFVSGVAALVKSRYPNDNAIAIKQRLMKGAEVRSNLAAYVSTSGRLSAVGALNAQAQINITPPVLTRIKYKAGSEKLLVYGTAVQKGVRVIVGVTGYSTKPKGDGWLAIVPKSALPANIAIQIKLRNPDGGISQPLTLTR
jgi:subtilisin family serine protease